jgi:hypothetical protein
LNSGEIPTHILDFVKTKTNDNFGVSIVKNKIKLSNTDVNEFSRETPLGIVQTNKVVQVNNERNTKYTFKVTNPTNANSVINLIVVDMGGDIIEYFIQYVFDPNNPSPRLPSGAIDMSRFTGGMTFYNMEGVIIGNFILTDGDLVDFDGEIDPCPEDDVVEEEDETDDSSNSNSGGGATNDTDPDGNNDNDDSSDGSTSGGGSGEVEDPDRPCGFEITYQPCKCGGSANGHGASECGCDTGSPTTITNTCNGDSVTYYNSRTIMGNSSPCDGPTGVLFNLEELEEEKLAIEVCLGNDYDAGWFDDNPENVSAIHDYLDGNCNAESKNFVFEIIAFNPDEDDIVDYELEMIIEINETIAFQEQTCLRKIKNDVVATEQISKIIKKFEPTYPVLHLEWGMFTNTDSGNTGNTGLNLEQNTAFINLNTESLDHVSNIVMVQTIAHEIIHAELYRKLKELVDDNNIISLTEYNALQDNFSGIADYTFRYGSIEYSQDIMGNLITWGLYPDFSLAHHNQMADFYRETIIDVMKAYDLSKNITRDNAEEFYEALSWAGLRAYTDDSGNSQYYDAWANFVSQIDSAESDIPIEDRTYNNYIEIISQEYGFGNSSETNTGINCN